MKRIFGRFSGVLLLGLVLVVSSAMLGCGGTTKRSSDFFIYKGRVLNKFGNDIAAGGWNFEKPRQIADVNGDGRVDIVGFGGDGVYVAISNGNGSYDFKNGVAIADYCIDTKWKITNHLRTMADVNGDNRADIVGFGNDYVITSLADIGSTFGIVNYAMNQQFTFKLNWAVDLHPRMVLDLNGDRRADIVGFKDGKAYVYFAGSEGRSFTSAGSYDFGTAQLWCMAEVDGKSGADIVGFGSSGVVVALNNGQGGFQKKDGIIGLEGKFSAGAGWDVQRHPRMLADIDGDKDADIIGFFDDGVHLAISNGDGTYNYKGNVLLEFGKNQQWSENNLRMMGDINGDGRADIIGFGSEGVCVALSKGDGSFDYKGNVLSAFCTSRGWGSLKDHPRMLGDVNGDGKPDLIGFCNDGVHVALAQ